jgi:hypothetical protein
MTDTVQRLLAARFADATLDDARAASIWRDVRRRTVLRPRRRAAPGLAVAGGLAAVTVVVAAASVQPLDGGGGPAPLASILRPIAPASASAAEVRRRALVALAQQSDSILVTRERQPIVGRPGVISESTSWASNSDGWASRLLIVDGGVAVLQTEQRQLTGRPGFLESIEYDPRSNTYVRSVSDLAHRPRTKPGMPPPARSAKQKVPPTAAESLRNAVASCHPRVVGHAAIDGKDVLVLADTSEPTMHRVLYVDPATYLPIRLVERPDGIGLVTIDYTWLPGSEAGQLWADPPVGAREVSQHDFPVKD